MFTSLKAVSSSTALLKGSKIASPSAEQLEWERSALPWLASLDGVDPGPRQNILSLAFVGDAAQLFPCSLQSMFH